MNRSLKIANAKLVQKGECWTRDQRLCEAWALFPLGVTFCYWIFLFSHSKASDANIGIIANFVYFVKKLLVYVLN